MATAKLIPIDLLDGKPRNLKLTNTGIVRFEERMGKSVEQVLAEGVNANFITTLLWASLLWEDKTLTWDDASDLIDRFVDASPTAANNDLIRPLLEALAESAIYRNRRKLNGAETAEKKSLPTSDSTPTDSM